MSRQAGVYCQSSNFKFAIWEDRGLVGVSCCYQALLVRLPTTHPDVASNHPVQSDEP